MVLHDKICAEVFTEVFSKVFTGLSSNIHSQGLGSGPQSFCMFLSITNYR